MKCGERFALVADLQCRDKHDSEEQGERILTTTVESNHGLKKELRLRDLVPMQILLMVGVSWAGIAAK